ncbi:hypothetical protein GA707_18055 [Nostocoides sp. F2B08]|uniref:hypothetical protein n=1 Tax=Nostocoides sp. F2B08 TaxID=2653936 RepID=UPI0012635DB3|nr:hypothetical protein [Tetrasphaera sp. F2B08]KAB7741447.1 hypothetical protein GA707_18055 [Tetrasphaera sp. F2B08]
MAQAHSWVDQRLARRLRLATPDTVVRAVMRSDASRIMELPPDRLVDAIADPRTRAASATHVGTWTFPGRSGRSL